MKIKEIIDLIEIYTGIDIWDADRKAYVADCISNYELKEFGEYELIKIEPVNESVIQLTVSKEGN